MSKVIDITDNQNDFIYRMVDFYLQESTKHPTSNPNHITTELTALVDNIMSYYVLGRNYQVFDIETARKNIAAIRSHDKRASITSMQDISLDNLAEIRQHLNQVTALQPEIPATDTTSQIQALEAKLRREIEALSAGCGGVSAAKQSKVTTVPAPIPAPVPALVPAPVPALVPAPVPTPAAAARTVVPPLDLGLLHSESEPAFVPSQDLVSALRQLKTRINTPFVHLVVTSIIFKLATSYLA